MYLVKTITGSFWDISGKNRKSWSHVNNKINSQDNETDEIDNRGDEKQLKINDYLVALQLS